MATHGNTGPLIGSIVGIHKYVYDIFGPGVNLAARMVALSEPMQITLCAETHELLKDAFACTRREPQRPSHARRGHRRHRATTRRHPAPHFNQDSGRPAGADRRR